ncbi:hypothetical protein BC628DRAFT_1103852 [Trametes gibbosa]|nr:hypothetical protein BC628DRAFT_1103852 [Trametes gibbosa]
MKHSLGLEFPALDTRSAAQSDRRTRPCPPRSIFAVHRSSSAAYIHRRRPREERSEASHSTDEMKSKGGRSKTVSKRHISCLCVGPETFILITRLLLGTGADLMRIQIREDTHLNRQPRLHSSMKRAYCRRSAVQYRTPYITYRLGHLMPDFKNRMLSCQARIGLMCERQRYLVDSHDGECFSGPGSKHQVSFAVGNSQTSSR